MTSSAARKSFTDALTGLTRAGLGVDQAISLGEEILAVARLLCDQPQLRRALADNDRPAAARITLLRSLLTGQVSETCLGILSTLIEGRWARPSELLDAAEVLGVQSFLLASETAGELATVEDELFRFGQIVAGDTRLSGLLNDMREGPRRERLIRDLLGGKSLPMTIRLALVALSGFRGRNFAGSMIWLVESAAKRRERMIAYVTAAVTLTDDVEDRLRALLSARYGSQLSLKVTVDPEVIGGLRVQVGSDLYDGTVARMLLRARHALAT